MTDLVVMSLERWDQVWRRNQHLVSGLIREDPQLRVLFVEPPADPVHDLVSRRVPSRGRRITPVRGLGAGRLWTYRPTKWLPRRIDANTDERLARAVMKAAEELGFVRPVLWINDPGAAQVAMSSEWETVYDMTDDWLAAERPSSELERVAAAEKYLLKHAAEVVACSPELWRRKTALRPPHQQPITVIPNAVDLAAYALPAERPADLPAGPIVAYVGTLHPDRLDVTLCELLAEALKGDGTLVLVGPDGLHREESARLRNAGAVLLGARHRTAVVGYLQHADVLIVPHVVTPFTDSLDPIKLYEYQAVGRPVVSTPVAGFRDVDEELFTVVTGRAFVEAVVSLVTVGAPPGPASSDVPDWSDRVRKMRAILARAQAGPGGQSA